MYLYMNKYKNQVTYIDGKRFASRKEAMHFVYLRSLQDKGVINNLQLQTSLVFTIDGKKIFTYKPDFEYDDDFGHHIVDVKGVQTDVFKLKKKIIEAQFNCKIEII